MPNFYQDPFLLEQQKLAGMQGTEPVDVNIPSLQTQKTNPSLLAPNMPQPSSLLDMAIAKKAQEIAPQAQQQSGYDPTGKTPEQVMAETGHQSDLDQMRKEPEKFMQPEPQQAVQPVQQAQQSQPITPQNALPVQPAPQVEYKQGELGKNITVTAQANKPYLNGRINAGTDFAGAPGTAVKLPEGQWEVITARNDIQGRRPEDFSEKMNFGWGNSVQAKNKETGEVIRLSHMQEGSVPSLKPGQVLNGGQVVGAIGNTGNTHGNTGYHLDAEYYNSQGQRQDVLSTPYAKQLFEGKEGVQVDIPSLQKPEQQAKPVDQVSQQVDPMLVSSQPGQAVMTSEQPQPQQTNLNPKLLEVIPESQREQAKTATPAIVNALKAEGITDPKVISYALATASHESGFVPKEEVMANRGVNQRNDYIAGLQDNYEGGKEYRGRGYIQLTHKGNYEKYGQRIGEDLVNNPDRAKDPEVAAKILAAYIKDSGVADAVQSGDYDKARVRVQGQGALNPQFIGTTREIANQAKQWEQYLQ